MMRQRASVSGQSASLISPFMSGLHAFIRSGRIGRDGGNLVSDVNGDRFVGHNLSPVLSKLAICSMRLFGRFHDFGQNAAHVLRVDKRSALPCAPMRGSPRTRLPIASNSALAAWIWRALRSTCGAGLRVLLKEGRGGGVARQRPISSICGPQASAPSAPGVSTQHLRPADSRSNGV